jgi:energy-coupling factor transporter transmembrane protein EcfT
MALNLVGLVLSAVVHFSTLMGVDPFEVFPFVSSWLLPLGLFVVCFPGFFVAQKVKREVFSKPPKWLVWMALIILAYAFVNWTIARYLNTLAVEGAAQKRDDGTYFVSGHGKVYHGKVYYEVRTISAEEFHRYWALWARWASGWLIVFYSWSLMILLASAGTTTVRQAPSNETGLRG